MGTYIPDRLRLLVAKRADYQCEYCQLHEEDSFLGFQVDHIISIKHEGDTFEANLAWSCFACNNNKGSDIGTVLLPDTRFVRLFNPRQDKWEDHFELIECVFYSKSDVGEATIKVLKLNDVERIMERQALL
jgi:5-methylcytosine-specific restriction endonuclease McrA